MVRLWKSFPRKPDGPRSIRYHHSPEKVLEEARTSADYYEENQPGLGAIFLHAVEKSLKTSYSSRFDEARLMRLTDVARFRVFHIDNEHIYAAAISQHRRKPGYWKNSWVISSRMTFAGPGPSNSFHGRGVIFPRALNP